MRSCAHDAIFRTFTRCGEDPLTLLVDLRPAKEFLKRHIALSYCIRLTSNGQALVGERYGRKGNCNRVSAMCVQLNGS